MADNDALPTAEQLQDLLLESPGFTEFLLGLTAISASLLGGQTPLLCAITVEREAGPATVASSTEAARALDERQYAYDNGPCLTALRQQHTVLIPDLQTDERLGLVCTGRSGRRNPDHFGGPHSRPATVPARPLTATRPRPALSS